MEVTSNQGRQLWERFSAHAPKSHQPGDFGTDLFSGKSGNPAGQIRVSRAVQPGEPSEQVERIIACARKMIELTRVDWVAQGCHKLGLKTGVARAKQPTPAVPSIPAALSGDRCDHLEQIGDWPRCAKGIRSAADSLAV